jgi:hypothetical protein
MLTDKLESKRSHPRKVAIMFSMPIKSIHKYPLNEWKVKSLRIVMTAERKTHMDNGIEHALISIQC